MIASLEEMPARCPVIAEAYKAGREARHLLYGKGRGTFRIIFDVQETQNQVRILRIWHAFRDALTAEDLRGNFQDFSTQEEDAGNCQ